jgi:hypothetical protein
MDCRACEAGAMQGKNCKYRTAGGEQAYQGAIDWIEIFCVLGGPT